MEYLWTPWRMAYITGGGGATPGSGSESLEAEEIVYEEEAAESTGCVFCDRAHLPESRDRRSLIVLRATRNFVILNLYPYNPGHLMVVPFEHTASLPDLDPETRDEMMSLVQRAVAALEAEYKPQGFNIGMNLGRVAGAGVADHLHMHVVPRWAGDTNFMPVVGSTKVLPEMLETTWDRLADRLQK